MGAYEPMKQPGGLHGGRGYGHIGVENASSKSAGSSSI